VLTKCRDEQSAPFYRYAILETEQEDPAACRHRASLICLIVHHGLSEPATQPSFTTEATLRVEKALVGRADAVP
jgi:hypothetical protein